MKRAKAVSLKQYFWHLNVMFSPGVIEKSRIFFFLLNWFSAAEISFWALVNFDRVGTKQETRYARCNSKYRSKEFLKWSQMNIYLSHPANKRSNEKNTWGCVRWIRGINQHQRGTHAFQQHLAVGESVHGGKLKCFFPLCAITLESD